MTPAWMMARGLVLAAGLLAVAVPVRAQTPAAPRPLLFLPGAQYGAPLKASGILAIYVPTHVEGGFRSRGWMADGGGGQAGARASFGRAAVLEYLETDLRAVVYRTWGSPRAAASHATYAGVEGGLSLAYARFSAGIAQRVAGTSGDRGTIVTWSAGVQVPVWAGSRATGGRRTTTRRGA